MPRGVVPDYDEPLLPLFMEPLAFPVQEQSCNLSYWTVFRKATHDFFRVIPKHTLTANGDRIRVPFVRLEDMPLQRGAVRPSLHPWAL
jgi:hypothetical protein